MALLVTLMVMAVLAVLIAAFQTITMHEISNSRGTVKSSKGFLAAEAGLNIRAEEIRQIFVDFNLPSGTSPGTVQPCEGTNRGTGDFRCKEYSVNARNVDTYVTSAGSAVTRTIPADELYGGLTAQEYRYTVRSEAYDNRGMPEALLELNFMSRLVPLFQFIAFYENDLEILPGPNMNLNGPVHTNGNLYLNSSGNTLTINGQVSAAGSTFRNCLASLPHLPVRSA